MTEEELLKKYLDAQDELAHFERMKKMMLSIFVGTFLFGITGIFILKVIS